MKTRPMLTLAEVQKMLEAGARHAEANAWQVTIAVADPGGHLLGLVRLDDAAPISATIAPEKARTAALGCRESKSYEDMINGGRNAFLSVPLNAMLEGGVPILVDGQVVGAVGVSGVRSNQDVEIARAAIAALGLGQG